MTRQSQWKHQQSCKGQLTKGDMQDVAVWTAKRKSSTIINGSGKSKYPKIEALVNEIINDGGAEPGSSTTLLPDEVPPQHIISTHESGEDITDTEEEGWCSDKMRT